MTVPAATLRAFARGFAVAIAALATSAATGAPALAEEAPPSVTRDDAPALDVPDRPAPPRRPVRPVRRATRTRNVAAVPAAAVTTAPGPAAIAAPILTRGPEVAASKKAAFLAAKARPVRPARPLARIGAPPTRVISLFNTWTHEWITVDQVGKGPDPTLVARFLRCHYTNAPTPMDPRLIGTLIQAARHFAVSRVDIVSGFRHPKYNLMLRKKGHEVAKESQHTRGTAVDFRLPGISTPALHNWARGRRLGGVGLYVGSGFIHMDTGPIRYWGGQ